MLCDDTREIRALQIAYGERFDARDAEGFAALYTSDAQIMQHNGRIFSGHDKLRKAVRNMPASDGFHRMGSFSVSVDADAARGECEYVARTSDGRYARGHYEDRYVRTQSGWRIDFRQVVIDAWLTAEEAAKLLTQAVFEAHTT
jgi:uncharacterized protein (TIGR02246 family)